MHFDTCSVKIDKLIFGSLKRKIKPSTAWNFIISKWSPNTVSHPTLYRPINLLFTCKRRRSITDSERKKWFVMFLLNSLLPYRRWNFYFQDFDRINYILMINFFNTCSEERLATVRLICLDTLKKWITPLRFLHIQYSTFKLISSKKNWWNKSSLTNANSMIDRGDIEPGIRWPRSS